MLAPVTEAEFGAQALLALNLDSAERWPAFAAELGERAGADVGYRRTGALVVAADRDDAEELRRLHAFQESLGLEVEWLGPRAARELEPALSPRIAGAIHAPHEGQADPRLLTRALAVALGRAGGELVTGVEVTAVSGDGVETAAAGALAARQVVVAAGCWSGDLGDGAPPVRPVKGQILRLRRAAAQPPLAERLIRTPRCYVVDRPGGEVVVGATVEDRGFDRSVTADGVYRLLEAAYEVLPDAAELEWVEAAARLRPGTPDNEPIVGRGDDGVVWATGHYRNGVLLTPVTADAVAAIVAGDDPPPVVDRFRPDRRYAGSAA
jgi:glycine oxidase